MNSVKIKGSAGQGIKFLGNLMANLLAEKGYEIAMINNYSPFVRYGNSEVKIVFSKEKIENPVTEEFDFEYDLTSQELKEKLSKKQNGEERMNITLLKKIIKDLDLEISEKEVENFLKNKINGN